MSILFLVCLGALVHAYLGYPLSLALGRLVRGDRSRHAIGGQTPTLTLVISAYNEERVIRDKILNSLELDYPPDAIRRVVASDGSTDGTDAIVAGFAARGVELRSFPGRRGKVACLNDVIPTLDTDLVVMSDSNSMYARDSLRKLVRHFADSRIGCVCGRLIYLNPLALAAGEGERVYWSYEGMIKRLESALGSLLGANGAIYAYRPEMFRPVDPLMFCDDVIPVRITLEGYLTVYDPEAWCTEEASEERVERRRRARHASFGLRSMSLLALEALARGRPWVAYQCLSHRILRWFGGLALGGLLLSSAFLTPPWKGLLLGGQAAFYGAALLGYVADRLRLKAAPLYLPYYFLVITAAGLRGLWRNLVRADRPFWEPRQ